MTEAWTWGDVAANGGVTPRTDTVDLVLDGNIAAELEKARSALSAAKRSHDTLGISDEIREAEGRVAELEERALESTRTFTVRAVGYRRWRELVEANRSDDPNERWDATTFVPAVLLECCDQFATEADVEQAIDVLSTGQIVKLFSKARLLNEGDDSVPTVRGR